MAKSNNTLIFLGTYIARLKGLKERMEDMIEIEQIKQLIAESEGVELSNWNTVTHAQRSAFAEIETRGRAWLISLITTIESLQGELKGTEDWESDAYAWRDFCDEGNNLDPNDFTEDNFIMIRQELEELKINSKSQIESQKEEIESQNNFFKGYDHQNRLIESRLEKQIESLQKENEQLHAELRNEKIKHYKYRCSTCSHFATRYSNSCQTCGSEGGYSGSFSIYQAEQWYDKQLSLSHIQEEEK